MKIGEHLAGESFYDVLGGCTAPVVIDEAGYGDFRVEGRGLAVWVRASAFENLVVNE